jgi:hypothetical protein
MNMARNGIYKAFSTNKGLENEGVILDFGVCKFKVRRAGGSNRRFATVFSAKTKPFQRAISAGTLPDETGRRLVLETYFETVVISWHGVTDQQGTVLEYTLQNFVQVMTDLPDLWNRLREECDNMRNFQDDELEEEVEKLGESLSGS